MAQPFTLFNLFLILMLSSVCLFIFRSVSHLSKHIKFCKQNTAMVIVLSSTQGYNFPSYIYIYHKHVIIIIIVSTQTTNYKRNFIRRFPFPRSFLRVGGHFLVNASLNNVKTLFSGRIDISETIAVKLL